MTQPSKNWFIIQVGAAPVYQEATFQSQCVTEAVNGESCLILNQKDNWIQIECEDGYTGWSQSFYGEVQSEEHHSTHRIVFPIEKNLFDPRFPFGAKVNKNLPGSIQKSDTLGLDQIIPVSKMLLGIPYKWGGKTSLGFDCSGLVQSVLNVCGLKVPRDAYQQLDFFKGDKIYLNEAEPGDLHFFGEVGNITHVGFSTGGSGIIHAQGKVKEESLDKKSLFFNENLMDIYLSSHSIRCKFRP